MAINNHGQIAAYGYYPDGGELHALLLTPTSACELANQLINTVISMNLAKNVENSYMANLKKVCTFVASGEITPAINQLNAFIQKVQQDSSYGNISAGNGNSLIQMAWPRSSARRSFFFVVLVDDQPASPFPAEGGGDRFHRPGIRRGQDFSAFYLQADETGPGFQ